VAYPRRAGSGGLTPSPDSGQHVEPGTEAGPWLAGGRPTSEEGAPIMDRRKLTPDFRKRVVPGSEGGERKSAEARDSSITDRMPRRWANQYREHGDKPWRRDRPGPSPRLPRQATLDAALRRLRARVKQHGRRGRDSHALVGPQGPRARRLGPRRHSETMRCPCALPLVSTRRSPRPATESGEGRHRPGRESAPPWQRARGPQRPVCATRLPRGPARRRCLRPGSGTVIHRPASRCWC